MLPDIWNVKDNEVSPHVGKFFSENKASAHRYKFSDDLIREIGLQIKDHPQTLIDNIQFALPPHDCIYMEFNLRVLLQAMGMWAASDVSIMDETIGYLIKGNVVAWCYHQRVPRHDRTTPCR